MTDKEQAEAVVDGLRDFYVGEDVWIYNRGNLWTIEGINEQDETARMVQKSGSRANNVPLRLLRHCD